MQWTSFQAFGKKAKLPQIDNNGILQLKNLGALRHLRIA